MRKIFLLVILAVTMIACNESNVPPRCIINLPKNNEVFTRGESIEIQIGAADPDGGIKYVILRLNNTLTDSLFNPPYTYLFDTDNLEAGNYTLVATAVDNEDAEGSDEVSFLVENPVLPEVTIISIQIENSTSFSYVSSVDESGPWYIISHGICWSTQENPTIEMNASYNEIPGGICSGIITGLMCGTHYYVRAFAISYTDTVYSEQHSITTTALPTIVTNPIQSRTATTAVCGGTITEDCGLTIAERGVCWSTERNPTTLDQTVPCGDLNYEFYCTLSNLIPEVPYYFRAYAITSEGDVYGEEKALMTLDSPMVVVDYDGNVYSTIIAGHQVWMAENMKATHYSDGTPIPNVESYVSWNSVDMGAFCWYKNDSAGWGENYGALYNWMAAVRVSDAYGNYVYPAPAQGVCPQGWHIPEWEEWLILFSHLGYLETAGGKLKEIGTNHWPAPNDRATDEIGFAALPGGFREVDGNFFNIGKAGYWWSATEHDAFRPRALYLYYGYNYITEFFAWDKRSGFSVRCVRD